MAAGGAAAEEKPAAAQVTDDTEYWLRQFDEALAAVPAIVRPVSPGGPPAKRATKSKRAGPAKRISDNQRERPKSNAASEESLGPFPPGYGDDVWEAERHDRGQTD